jgi:hypothetical protein
MLPVVTLAALAALLLACGGGDGAGESTFSEPGPITVDLPAGLPGHLGLGLMNNPQQLDWMTGSGIPWDYRNQYLAGGVNTGEGWTGWGDPAGIFVDQYLLQSSQNGYIPVFTYYQVVQSAPDPGSEDVATKLRDPSTMRAYFEDWELLMRRLGAFGKTVIVHVEPDLWGYMQRENGDAAKVRVQVRSTGLASVADFDDTAAGFAQALAHLRDLYAPNALLGFHVSSWATGKDLIINRADPARTAATIAAFYRSLGVEFDLLFLDVSDRDAAWYEMKTGKKDHWWGDSDLARYRSFIGNIVSDTGRPAVLWQVPIGNTLYRSMDNSWGHFQDNRAQYWLGERQHMQELADAGVIAVLFGSGADGCTMYTDEMGDGVTNPAPINGNDRVASYPDDDGGYLRLSASEYYSGGPVPVATPRSGP